MVVAVDTAKVPPRLRAAPAIATALAAFRALGADVEDAVIWRGHPDLAYTCAEVDGDYVVIRAERPYCRYGVAEPLDSVDPAEVSAKLVQYSAEYDAVGLLVAGRSREAVVEAEVYALGSAEFVGLPPVDAIVDVEAYIGSGKVEGFYAMFKHAYEAYAAFVKRLSAELARPIPSLGKPPTHFLESIDVIDGIGGLDPAKAVPLFRRDAAEVVGAYAPRRPGQQAALDLVNMAFADINGLLLPRSPKAFEEFVAALSSLWTA